MTDFDLGEPAPDADDDLEPTDDQDDSSTETPSVDETPTKSEPDQPDRSALSSDPEPPADESSSEDADDPDPIETGPAFPYSEVDQNPLYAREETWNEFNYQLDVELTPMLREEGIMDNELREIHDIVLEIALDNLEEIPERLKEKRRNQ